MAAQNRSKERIYRLAESQLCAIELSLEQIEGLAELIHSHYEDVASDVGTITALKIIKEKSRLCAVVLRAGYAELKAKP